MFIILFFTLTGFLIGLVVLARQRGVRLAQILATLTSVVLAGVIRQFLSRSNRRHSKRYYDTSR